MPIERHQSHSNVVGNLAERQHLRTSARQDLPKDARRTRCQPAPSVTSVPYRARHGLEQRDESGAQYQGHDGEYLPVGGAEPAAPRADGTADRIREPGTAAEFGQVTTAQQQLSRYDHAMRQQAIAEVVDEPSDAHRGKLGNQYGGKEIAVAIAPMADTARMPSFAESRM